MIIKSENSKVTVTDIVIYLRTAGFIDYAIVFLLVFAATYFLFLNIPLFISNPEQKKKLGLIIGITAGLIFISNDQYIEALKTTVMDYGFIIIMVVFIALMVASILYIASNYSNP